MKRVVDDLRRSDSGEAAMRTFDCQGLALQATQKLAAASRCVALSTELAS